MARRPAQRGVDQGSERAGRADATKPATLARKKPTTGISTAQPTSTSKRAPRCSREPASTSAGRWSRSTQRTINTTEAAARSEEHTSELQSLMRISYAVFCLKKKIKTQTPTHHARQTRSTHRTQSLRQKKEPRQNRQAQR